MRITPFLSLGEKRGQDKFPVCAAARWRSNGGMNETVYTPLRDLGLLVLRVGLGCAFIAHGWPKVAGGPEVWTGVGNMAGTPAPAAFGLVAGLVELLGGVLLILGLFLRVAALFLAAQMAVALFRVHLPAGHPYNIWSHPLEDGVVFVGLILTGAGRYSLDAALARRRRRVAYVVRTVETDRPVAGG